MSARLALSPAQLARDLAIPDLSDPADGPHAIQVLAELAAAAVGGRYPSQLRWCRGPRIVTVADNYDALGYDPADVTRAVRYTRYVDDSRMLRSHSTALVPAALRQLAADLDERSPVDGWSAPAADVLLACPGICYRRDAIDWQHTGTPQQLDLWLLSRRPLVEADLEQMIGALLAAVVPGRRTRQIPRDHPYTTAGRQVDVEAAGPDAWVEVWECGLAAPRVLGRAGLAGWHGLALGMGLDRLLMLRKGIPDIRLLRSADSRVAGQMLDLAPYRPVSRQPAVRRDLSVAVDAADDDETLGDRVREALGPDADAVEEVAILSCTAAEDLPPAAVRRLGLQPGQRNVLLRVVLRRLEHTLTDAEANQLRDRVYAAVHRGSAYQWAHQWAHQQTHQ
jgi:phenylalanyl-tRNA synthetase alpha chain